MRAPKGDVITTRRVGAAERLAGDAAKRDEEAARRDLAAAARDRAAEDRGRELTRLAESLDGPSASQRLRAEVKRFQAQAAADRASAADDRRLAADDRERASWERAQALEALRCAHFDELTGAHRRGFGEELLRAEIERARRGDGRLAVAFVDVDGLKEINDSEGHLAGDQLLCELVQAIRSNIRSYEPIIRLGGDEFAFAMSGFDADDMRERCAVIRADLARGHGRGSVAIGIAELEPGDELKDLLRRADEALVEARRSGRRAQDALRG